VRWSKNLNGCGAEKMSLKDFNPNERAFPFVNSKFESFINVTKDSVTFKGQLGSSTETGVNGCQIQDILTFALGTLQMHNTLNPCRERALAITKLQESLHWLDEHEYLNKKYS
jgi:hypothetical protein